MVLKKQGARLLFYFFAQIFYFQNGMKAEDVIFKQEKEDLDDGMKIFEVNFFVPGEKKYEFDIDDNTGKINDQDIDLWNPEDDYEYAALIEATKEKAN